MNGHIRLSRALTLPEYQYLKAFGATRRQQWNVEKIVNTTDRLREAVGLPMGTDGEFVVHDHEAYGHLKNGNEPPGEQPFLWCGWRVSQDGTELVWDENDREDEYRAGPWLKYLVPKIFEPWGIVVNGQCHYQDREGAGVIIVRDNDVRDVGARLSFLNPFTQQTEFIDDEA